MSSKFKIALNSFEFLILNFELIRLGVAQKTVERMVDKVSRLYEPGADDFRIETYLKRWWQWVLSGVDGVLTAGVRSQLGDLFTLSSSLSVGLVRYSPIHH